MAGKELRPPNKRDRARIKAAVHAAEAATGMQVCVYVGHAGEDTRAHAEELFVAQGMHARPAVLLLVAPAQRSVEIVTAPESRDRFPDEAAARAIEAMTEWFGRGRLAEGIDAAIDVLVASAGPGEAPPDAVDLPDLLD